MTAFERDGTEVEALLTDLYLERVLARAGTDLGPADVDLDPALRAVSDRLRRDLTRVHPSFRFEERLAVRLAEAAAAARLPVAAGADGGIVSLRLAATGPDGGFDPLADEPEDDDDRREIPVPLLIGGALTSAAISLAGAAYVAWRRTRTGRAASPMVRAARAARAARLTSIHAGRLD
jgi:hypothetical protein